MLILEIVLGCIAAVSIGFVMVGLLEFRSEMNHDLKVFDRQEFELHVRHLAKENHKRIA